MIKRTTYSSGGCTRLQLVSLLTLASTKFIHHIISITDKEGANRINDISSYICTIEDCSELCQPLILALPIQLLAYHIAVFKGTDVDQPRNLAKSVTVE